eukprot:Sdes_comp20699_c0_seq1m16303
MKLFKPEWVSHNGEPIFSVDFHPGGKRFATAGQDSKIKVWSFECVKNHAHKKSSRLLCTIANHLGSVNCLRFSHDGFYLASGSDDHTGLIFCLTSQDGGEGRLGGLEEGGGGFLEDVEGNIENWKCIHTLREHSGDVIHVSWSKDDGMLSTCSVDNCVIIWSAVQKFAKLKVLHGHSGFVQGVAWDPIGKYLASQSEDKSVIVWRTKDWKIEKKITDPFQESSGTTIFRRLDWSPDGQFLIAAHAKNNVVCSVATILLRDSWLKQCDLVGHDGPVVASRFNHLLYDANAGSGGSLQEGMGAASEQKGGSYFLCCALGSQDCTLSVWITSRERPLLALKHCFDRTIVDLCWAPSGGQLIACSYDGTVVYVDLAQEIGVPLSEGEKEGILSEKYGNLSRMLCGAAGGVGGGGGGLLSLPENPEQLLLQLEKKKKKSTSLSRIQQDNHRPDSVDMAAGTTLTTAATLTTPSSVHLSLVASSCVPLSSSSSAQKETRTKDGRRRIVPQFMGGSSPAPRPPLSAFGGSAPAVEAAEGISSARMATVLGSPEPKVASEGTPAGGGSLCGGLKLTGRKGLLENRLSSHPISAESAGGVGGNGGGLGGMMMGSEEASGGGKREAATTCGGKKSVKSQRSMNQSRGVENAAYVDERTQDALPAFQGASWDGKMSRWNVAVFSTCNRVPCGERFQSHEICGGGRVYCVEVDNECGKQFRKVSLLDGGAILWTILLAGDFWVSLVAGNGKYIFIACGSELSVVGRESGRKLFPVFVGGSPICVVECKDEYLLWICADGSLRVFDLDRRRSILSLESIYGLFFEGGLDSGLVGCSSASLERSSFLTLLKVQILDSGAPVLTRSDGRVFLYDVANFHTWCLLSDPCCDFRNLSVIRDSGPVRGGRLASLQGVDDGMVAGYHSLGLSSTFVMNRHRKRFEDDAMVSPMVGVSFVEQQLLGAVLVDSLVEYRYWVHVYVKLLVGHSFEVKLREFCEDLLGPPHVCDEDWGKNGGSFGGEDESEWRPFVVGVSKREIFCEIFPLICANRNLQRLATELKASFDLVMMKE